MKSLSPMLAIFVGALGIVVAAGPVACSSGGGSSPDAGGTSGSGGASAGSGGASAGGGGAVVGGAGGAGQGAGGAGQAGTGPGGGGGSAGSGGTAGSVAGAGGGAAGAGGRGGAATGGGGSAGGGGAAGTGGRPAGTCTFDVQHTQSAAIGTVRIVTWTLDVADLTEAHIDFGPSGAAPTMKAPVDLREPSYRTVLVGMKAAKPYTFRIVATDSAKTCTSADFSFTTGALPSTAPAVTRTMTSAGAAKGFIVTSGGINPPDDYPAAYVFDTDGDVVWWSSPELSVDAEGVSRAHLSWDAKAMWVMTSSSGKIHRIAMDGLTTTDFSNVIKLAHHDFTVLPDGGIATMLGRRTSPPGHAVVELKPDGTVTTVVANLSTLYPVGTYPNAIHYYPADDSYTVSDLGQGAFIKFTRKGALVWQLGGSNPAGKVFTLMGLTQWMVNHGHHLTPDGRFLFFNNGGTTGERDMPRALEVSLDTTNNTATKTWEYAMPGVVATALGDVERLPNGNALITMTGVREVDRSGTVVQQFNALVGYADFRASLYGPPPR